MPSNSAESQSVILFDGVCNFCDRSIQFILARDRKKRFQFAPLQSEAGRRLAGRCGLSADYLDSLVLVEAGRCHVKSAAALRIARRLSGPWPVFSLLLAVPAPVRDVFYDAFARRRYRWFGKKQACMVPSPEDRARFLD